MINRAPPTSPRLAKPTEFKETPGLKNYIDRLITDLIREFLARPTKTEAIESVLLISPGGKVFKVTVNDAGAVVTTEMAS